jgi:alanyl-tRNA synthetase
MAATERLYHHDPLRLAFGARVCAHGRWKEQPSLILDRTAFYPESGGQMADRGELAGRALWDVQVDDQGQVHHLFADAEQPLPPVGQSVEGRVDRARRREHMALHTGQHILSRALLDVAGAQTASSRLGERSCTIDLACASLEAGKLDDVLGLANRVIDDDREVRGFFPDDAELARLELRRPPKQHARLRVVRIGGFDMSACGGTHCSSTAQVGLLHVSSVERFKKRLRIHFVAGARARRHFAEQSTALQALSERFTCAPVDVHLAVDKVQRQLRAARNELGQAHESLAELFGNGLRRRAAEHPQRLAVAQLEQGQIELLRSVAQRVSEVPDLAAAVAGPTEDGLCVVVARGEQHGLDCGALVKALSAAHGGRGGGRPARAEGRLPSDVDWPAAVEAQLRIERT